MCPLAVTFNHATLAARDRQESARFMAEVLGLEEPTSWGPFTQVGLDGGVFIQFAEPAVEEIQMQHYAFLVDDDRFDEILARVQARGIPYTADPNPSRPYQINTNHGGRGFYFRDPAGHGFEVLTRPYGSDERD
jgi:catechol 2,3-dioxygenase-like lactoylglutathione lyase family enzyme